MKNTSILCFFCMVALQGQNTFISKVKVEYDVVRINGNTNVLTKATLLFNTSNSEFIFKDVPKPKAVSLKEVSQPGDHSINVDVVYRDTLENRMYYDKSQNTEIRTALDFNSRQKVYIRDVISKLEWAISDEAKKIQDFNCIKANLKNKGGSYTAWFSTDIPTSFGPYDFGQLPGVIMELYSEDHQLYVAATKVTYPFEELVNLPASDLDFISKNDYEMRNKRYLDSIAGAIQERAVRILTKNQRGVNISNVKIESKVINNKKDD